jgi:sterol desaturase/sphingolipid hydroxylase (fatty acid hydroxylase superfamily)
MRLSAIASFLVHNPNSTQLCLFGALLLSLWIAERTIRAQSTFAKLRHTWSNVLFLTGVLPVQLAMMVVCVAAASWTGRAHFGLVYLLPHAQSPWIKYGLMFLALDLLDYVYHYIAHHLAPLWRLHLVHHTDRAVDVSTTFREHPAETLVRVCFLIGWVLLCGASVEVLILRQTVETFSNVLQHTVFRLPGRSARVLGWFFVTSNLHHTHHHCSLPGTNCNYGDVFSIWDRLFGTYVDMPREDTVFGLDTHMSETNTGTLHLLGLGGLFAQLRRSPAE